MYIFFNVPFKIKKIEVDFYLILVIFRQCVRDGDFFQYATLVEVQVDFELVSVAFFPE